MDKNEDIKMEKEIEGELKKKIFRKNIIFKLDQHYPKQLNIDLENYNHKTPKEATNIIETSNSFPYQPISKFWWNILILWLLTTYIFTLYGFIFALSIRLGIIKI